MSIGLKSFFQNDSSVKNQKTSEHELIYAPITGVLTKLELIKDEAFSKGYLGEGIAIVPQNGEVFSPVDGVVTMLFPTKHAIGITSKHGTEILIHIGLDTVNLNGKHFKAFVKQGQKVRIAQKLIEFDYHLLKSLGYDLSTPVVITNKNEYQSIEILKIGCIVYNSELLKINILK